MIPEIGHFALILALIAGVLPMLGAPLCHTRVAFNNANADACAPGAAR